MKAPGCSGRGGGGAILQDQAGFPSHAARGLVEIKIPCGKKRDKSVVNSCVLGLVLGRTNSINPTGVCHHRSLLEECATRVTGPSTLR